MPKVDVLICGRIYTITGTESEEYIDKVAKYVDRKMTAVADGTSMRMFDQELISTLTSVNIGDELFKEFEVSANLRSNLAEKDKLLESYSLELGKMQDENIALLEKISELQLDMAYLKSQLQSKTEEVKAIRKEAAMEKLKYEKKPDALQESGVKLSVIQPENNFYETSHSEINVLKPVKKNEAAEQAVNSADINLSEPPIYNKRAKNKRR